MELIDQNKSKNRNLLVDYLEYKIENKIVILEVKDIFVLVEEINK